MRRATMLTDTQFKSRVLPGSLHSLTTSQACLPKPISLECLRSTTINLQCLNSPCHSPYPLFYKMNSNLMTCSGAFRYVKCES